MSSKKSLYLVDTEDDIWDYYANSVDEAKELFMKQVEKDSVDLDGYTTPTFSFKIYKITEEYVVTAKPITMPKTKYTTKIIKKLRK